MFRMLMLAYVAIPVLAAATFNSSAVSTANSMTCPCGQCEAGCGCCLGGGCTCADCACEACGCDAGSSLVSTNADFSMMAAKSSCCAGGTCSASKTVFETLANVSGAASQTCPCGQCEDGCGCCLGGGCTCADCACEACGCDASTSLVSASAEAGSTCKLGSCCSEKNTMATELISIDGGCDCDKCPADCDGEDCRCEGCECPNCQE